MTDPIADMITRIRNGSLRGLDVVVVPSSRLKVEILEILKKEGYINDFVKKGKGSKKFLEIVLRYENVQSGRGAGKPVISHIARVSKSGQRVYSSWRELRPVLEGFGIAVLSTPQGLMIDKEARKKKLGGEVLVEVW